MMFSSRLPSMQPSPRPAPATGRGEGSKPVSRMTVRPAAATLMVSLGLAAGCATERWSYEPDLAATLPAGTERSTLSVSFPLAPEGNRSSGVVAVSARGQERERIGSRDERRIEVVFFFDAAESPVAFDWTAARLYDVDQLAAEPTALVEGDPGTEIPPRKAVRKVVVFSLPAGRTWNPRGFRLQFDYTLGHVTVTREAHFLLRDDPYYGYGAYAYYPYYSYGYPYFGFGYGCY